MGASLSRFSESKLVEDRDDLARLERRNPPHALGDLKGMCTDELCLEVRLPILEEHRDDLTEVGLKFLNGGALRVRARPAGNEAYVQAGVLVPLDYGCESAHRDVSAVRAGLQSTRAWVW